MTKKVIIIGGGVIGMSTAFQLAEKGVKDITIIEKDNIGSGSSCLLYTSDAADE